MPEKYRKVSHGPVQIVEFRPNFISFLLPENQSLSTQQMEDMCVLSMLYATIAHLDLTKAYTPPKELDAQAKKNHLAQARQVWNSQGMLHFRSLSQEGQAETVVVGAPSSSGEDYFGKN